VLELPVLELPAPKLLLPCVPNELEDELELGWLWLDPAVAPFD